MAKKKSKKEQDREYAEYWYRWELQSIQKRMSCSLLIIVGAPLLWCLLFVVYPKKTMVDIKGVLVEKMYTSQKGRAGAFSRTYFIKMDNFRCPFRLRIVSRVQFPEISDSVQLTVQIQEKDLNKLKDYALNKSLKEYSDSELLSLPRIYGIKAGDKVLITSTRALIEEPTPLLLGGICQFVVGMLLFFTFIFFGFECKRLYKLLITGKAEELK